MPSKPRLTLRYALGAIAILAVAFALLRPVYDLYRANLRHQSQIQRGTSIILAFRPLCPVEVPVAKWKDAISAIRDSWQFTISKMS
jgi:hypothetical protein